MISSNIWGVLMIVSQEFFFDISHCTSNVVAKEKDWLAVTGKNLIYMLENIL